MTDNFIKIFRVQAKNHLDAADHVEDANAQRHSSCKVRLHLYSFLTTAQNPLMKPPMIEGGRNNTSYTTTLNSIVPVEFLFNNNLCLLD